MYMDILEFLVKLVLSAVMLSGFIFGMLWFMRKKGVIPMMGNGSSSYVKVISSVKLTPKSYLFAVSLNNNKKNILIGVTEKTVSFICDLE